MSFPAPPDPHAIAVLGLTVFALFLFSRERIPLETSSLLVIVILTVGFQLVPYQRAGLVVHPLNFFHGFGHEALVAVCALMVVGHGLVRTGALEPVGVILARMWSISPTFSMLGTLVIGASLSAFMNNTPIVVLLLPILVGMSMRSGVSASGVLMPMGFATLIGGMCTTIGTSTNLLVVAVAADLGMREFGMFDFIVPASIAGGIAILYLWLIAPRLLPDREPLMPDASPRLFSARINIREDSSFVGKTLSEAIKKTGGSMKVNRIRRGDDTQVVPLPDAVLRAGDQLVVRDTPRQLKEYERVLDATLYTGNVPVDEEHPLTAGDQQLAELVVIQASPVNGASLRSVRFVERHQLAVLALHRQGREFAEPGKDIADIVLRAGDVLLVQGPQEELAKMKREGEMLVLDATADVPHTQKAPYALSILAGVVLLAAFGILPIAISAVCGALLLILTGCLRWSDASHALSSQVIMIVVASLALGSALLQTGGTAYVTQVFLAVTSGASPTVILSGLVLLMAMLTNIVSNNAAGVIGAPIAIEIARQLGLPPEPFVLAVLFGANMSYATPMAYQTNLLVMTAGNYKFSDFVRIGVPLTLIMWLSFSWLLPKLYGI
ncbi:MAG: SLC13 family permease [Gammaproteobacteria bacterium]|nr:SLC13 family permease [Gammaproteobacteria bacterium]